MPTLWDLFKDKRTPEERAERQAKLSKSKPRRSRSQDQEVKEGRNGALSKRDEDLTGMIQNLTISTEGSPFSGGFRHPRTYSPRSGSSSSPAFPVPNVMPPTPGPLPQPPAFIPMPIPYASYGDTSLTMRHALQPVGSSPPTFLHPAYTPPSVPPVLSRPASAPDESFRDRRQARLDIATPPRVGRSNSEPVSPDSAGKSARARKARSELAEDEDPETCGGMTKAGKRCTRKVKTPGALDSLNPGAGIVRFCHQHEKEFLSSTGFYTKRDGEKDKWVAFDDWIPEHLQPDTKAALRVEMEKRRSKSDVPGYIYAFEIRDPNTPKLFHIKVGRAVNLNKRIDQWSKQCGSKEQVLRGFWPGSVDADETSLMKGRVVPGEKGACCHRLERLIHLELADVTLHQPHYRSDDQSGEDVKLKSKQERVGQARKACADCGTIHKEIFSFDRPTRGQFAGKEWDLLVKPVIKRWGEFVEAHV